MQKAEDIISKLREATGIDDISFKRVTRDRSYLYLGRNHAMIWEEFHFRYPEVRKEVYAPIRGSPVMLLTELVDWTERWMDKIIEVAREVNSWMDT